MVPIAQQVRNYYYSGAQMIRRSSSQTFRSYDYIFTKPRSKADNKIQAAIKHSQAERRRRLRINSQYETLKNLFRNNNTNTKTDKASLLAATIEIIKNLRKTSSPKEEASSSRNEMKRVSNQKEVKEACSTKEMQAASSSKKEMKEASNPTNDDVFPSWEDKWGLRHEEGLMKATLNCEDKPGLMSTIAKALGSVEAKVVKAEMVTVGGRTRIVLWVKDSKGEHKGEEILKRTLGALMQKSAPKKRRYNQ